jgi:hypothetical protein
VTFRFEGLFSAFGGPPPPRVWILSLPQDSYLLVAELAVMNFWAQSQRKVSYSMLGNLSVRYAEQMTLLILSTSYPKWSPEQPSYVDSVIVWWIFTPTRRSTKPVNKIYVTPILKSTLSNN